MLRVTYVGRFQFSVLVHWPLKTLRLTSLSVFCYRALLGGVCYWEVSVIRRCQLSEGIQ